MQCIYSNRATEISKQCIDDSYPPIMPALNVVTTLVSFKMIKRVNSVSCNQRLVGSILAVLPCLIALLLQQISASKMG